MPANRKNVPVRLLARHAPENPLHIRLTQMFEAVAPRNARPLEARSSRGAGAARQKSSITKLLEGDIAFHPSRAWPLSTIVPVAAMEGLPFAFESEDEASG